MRSASVSWRLVVALLFLGPLAPSTAWAQGVEVPFQTEGDGQAAWCGVAVVEGLDPNGDNFLAVRAGPGSDYRKLGEIHEGDQVRTCDRRGPWVGVLWGPDRRMGWAHGNWLRMLDVG